MAIRFDKAERLFTIETKNSEYQIKVNEIGVVLHVYYGAKTGMDMSYMLASIDRGFSGNPYEIRRDRGRSLDVLPQEFSGCGVGDYRVSSLALIGEDGSRSCDLRYDSYEILSEKAKIPGLPGVRQITDTDAGTSGSGQTLRIRLTDPVIGLAADLYYSVFEDADVITRRVELVNLADVGSQMIVLEKAASVCVDFPYADFDLIHFHGRHCMERQMERAALTHDIHTISSRRGMSSHHENPFVVLCDHKTTETSGDAYGCMLEYSGNHKTEVELDQAGSTRLVMGIGDENFSWRLAAGETFCTPEVILSYSSVGLEQLSHNFHDIIRSHVIDRKYREVQRPVLVNNWEATYFDFDKDKILALAHEAADLGVEMLVLDDGWFGKREDDNSGLGDWFVNEKKLPGGLSLIVEEVNKLGMKFGLWFEPEMVNEDSELFREHPEWALRDPNRDPMMSRNQMVLDMGNPSVVDYLYETICQVLESANIEYVKWDFNRSVANVYSNVLPAEQQGEAAHRFMLGTYELLERLLTRFPKLMIEGCSGGGGRFDAGMLYYCPQIWCSDDTDPIARLKIQYGTSFGYPVSAVGSHVSASPNHQTGRVTSFQTRSVAAMSGTFGYELDLGKLTEAEKTIVRSQIRDFHEYYWTIQKGAYYRLTDVTENTYYTAWEFVSEDKSRVLLNVVFTDVQANPQIPCIRLRGLEPEKIYTVTNTISDETRGLKISGAALMNGGYVLKEIQTGQAEESSYPAYQIYLCFMQ